jgi:hypothetical protein
MIIWLASYPKSGNTFLRSLLSAYLFTKDGNFLLNSIKSIKQFPAEGLFKKFGVDTSDELAFVKNYIKVQEKINSQDRKTVRFFKTHSGLYDINGYKFTDLNNTLGVIYIVRDPRSVVQSYANHQGMSLELATNTLLEFSALTGLGKHTHNIEEKTKKITHVGSWSSNYNTWKEFKKSNKYLLVKYEDLVLDTEKAFLEILNFIYKLGKSEIQIDNKKLKNTIESTTFSKMQKLEKEKGFIEEMENVDGKKITFFKYGPKKNDPNALPKFLKNKIEKEFKIELEELHYI